MGLSIQHNMLALNADRMLGLEKCTLAKSTEKLSSGYKINRAADDAAGLAISEKLRRTIRGLAQGTENAQDGISWVQIGDGALEEAQEILQRMNELAIKSANGTNSATDRVALNDEFSQLKNELNRVSAATKFNDIKIFSNHKPLWYQTRGNMKWNPYDQHVIEEGKNELTIKYYPGNRDGSPQEITFAVPPGQYSTLELLDELDTAIAEQMNGYDTWFEVEYADDGHININLEGGAYIESVTGDLSYLLYEMYKGGGTGALLGTTIFTTDTDKLKIVAGRNDHMEFDIEDLKGNKTHMNLTIPEGSYTRNEIMDKLNDLLKDTSVRATAYGRSIKLGSNKEFVTGFIGNMFSIDGPDYTSVFYDNVKSGDLSMYAAQFTGGCVMIADSYSVDEEHKVLTFDDTNNELILQPDGCDAPVKITIDEGSYTLAQIRGKLETLFNEAGLHLNVGTWSESIQTGSPYGGTSYTTFYGLTITTDSKGPDSKVGIDSNSSAYNTLFVDRSYIYYGPKATTSGDVRSDYDASFTGSRNLGNVTAQNPFTLTSDNNSFSVSVKGTDDASARSATISLDPGKTYDSADAIVDEVNAQLANKGLSDLIMAKLSTSNTLQLVEAEHGDVTGYISVSAATGSNGTTADKNGYKALFVEQTIRYDPKTEGKYGSLSFDTPGVATGNTLTITVKGKPYNVDLSGVDKSDPEQIAQKINDTIKGETKTENYTFSSTPHGGTTTDNNFSTSNTGGRTTITPWSGQATGKSGSTEGATGGTPSTAAELTVGPKLKASMDISAANNNNKIRLTINGRTETLTLKDGNYTQETLRKELQDQITAIFGTGSAGAAVTLKNDQLVITSGLTGNDSKVACNTNDSSLLAWLNTTKYGASCDGGYYTPALSNSITITDNINDKFVFEYRGPGSTSGTYTTCTLDLKGGTYDRNGIITQINDQLKAQGLDSKIEAYLSGSRLGLRTKGDLVGDGTSIKYSTGSSSAADAMFGGLINKQPAYVNTTRAIQDSITIESGAREFTLKVDNTADGASNPTTVTVQLPVGTFDRNTFLTKLNEQLAGKGVTASLVSSSYYDYANGVTIPKNSLQFTTTTAGSGTYVDVSYISPEANSKSAMQAIYGTYDTVYPAVKASFDDDNKLTITAVKADGSTDTSTYITVNSRTSAGLLADTETPTETSPSSNYGYHSRTKTAINGVSFSSYKLDGVNTTADTVTIDAYNNNLSFDVYRNGMTNTYDPHTYFSLILDQKTYTYAELQQALQDKLDAAGSPVAGKMKVTVNDNGVKIEAKDYGNAYQFLNLRGGFYLKVLSAGEEIHEKKTATNNDGYQVVNGAYTIGRKNVSGGAEIVEGVCDELSFDLVIQGKRETLSMVLDPGKYSAKELIKEVQSKVDEQLVEKGLNPGLVEVNIGGIDSGIAGNNDHNALNFRISKDVQAPQVGDYLIEGVTGNAAFEIFYQTEGKIIPAYIMGSKDVVSKGVTIGPEDGDLTIAVDDDVYTINLDPGTYTATEIIDALNEAFGDDIPLTASINQNDGRVKLSYTELGHHEIKYVTGGAKDDVFFDETGGRDNTYRNIQLSSEIPDYIPIKRSEFNTNMLRIGSLNVLGERYALKAIDRLSMAINRVSALRTDFGVTQNRLEHAINSNRNKEENVTAAESRIRDTDMAKEMVRYSNLKILEQAGISVLTQAGKSQDIILGLLQ